MSNLFARIATVASHACGRPLTFFVSLLSVVIWAGLGPLYHYSDTWQLVANTATTVVTFLVVFLIQNSQNRDTAAIHLKLDELVRATEGARNEIIRSEAQTEEQIRAMQVKDQS